MLGEFFAGNIIVALIITVIIITSYSHFEENQQLFLIYLMFYGLSFFKVVPIRISAILFLPITFVYLEYLSVDKKKLELIVSFWYKTIDYLFLMVFQLHVFGLSVSLLLLFLSHIAIRPFNYIATGISLFVLILTEHLVITQPFKIKSITDISKPFAIDPYYKFNNSEEAHVRYEMLCQFEDKTYLYRENSYSSYTFEYISVYGKRRFIKNFVTILFRIKNDFNPNRIPVKKLISRGYSTPEMQLIRTIGIKRGYIKFKYFRKIFEILYAKIFFASLKQHYFNNSGLQAKFFREYILDVYLKNVLTKINGRRFSRLCNAFENPEDVSTWPLEGLFIACLGLTFKKINLENISVYNDILVDFDLDVDKIFDYSKIIADGKKIPCISTNNCNGEKNDQL